MLHDNCTLVYCIMGVQTNKWNIYKWKSQVTDKSLFWKHPNVSISLFRTTVMRCLTKKLDVLNMVTTTKKTKTERLSVSLYFDLIDYRLACVFRSRLTKGLGSHAGEGMRYLQWHQFESSLTGKCNRIRDRIRLESTAYLLTHSWLRIHCFFLALVTFYQPSRTHHPRNECFSALPRLLHTLSWLPIRSSQSGIIRLSDKYCFRYGYT